MPTTDYTDAAVGVSTIGDRTDAAGVDVTDWSSSEARLINDVLTEGYLTDGAFEVQADSPASMDVIVGSGTSGADVYVVAGDDDGQHNYLCRLDTSGVTVTLDAADASNGRIDQVWLVVSDNTYDSGGVSLPRIGYRKGDASASPTAPGADSSWKAAVLLASVTVGAGVSSVAAGDITDQRSSAELNEVLRAALAGASDLTDVFALVAGDTFTGPVTFEDPTTFESGAIVKLADDVNSAGTAATSFPNGLTTFVGTSGAGWPATKGMVFTVKDSTSDGTVLQWYMTSSSPPPVLMFRRWVVGSSSWSDWETVVTRENPSVSSWEVDNSTEVSGPVALTGSMATAASVSLTIPSDWGSWKCFAYATYEASRSPGATGTLTTRIVIDGSAQQQKDVLTTGSMDGAIGGRRTGMTTTGSRTVALQGSESGDDVSLREVFLYARAVRTS